MSKVKKLRTKIDNSSFGDDIDIGADAINVDVVVNDTTQNLQATIDSIFEQIKNVSIEWNQDLPTS